MIVISCNISTVCHRTKVTVAFINHWGRAIDVLESINSKAIIGVAEEGTMFPSCLDVVTCGSFVVVVLRTWSNWRSHVAATEKGNHRGVHIVAFSL